jgi:predicted GH43/DUF377 family glycosyl hydrolase
VRERNVVHSGVDGQLLRKSGAVLVGPEAGELGVDVPYVYEYEGRYRLMFVAFDGEGYRNGVAESSDLLHWRRLPGQVFPWGPVGAWDAVNCAGTWILRENALMGPARLRRVGGRYWMAYHAYPERGYERGPGAIGLASSDDLRTWQRAAAPALRAEEGGSWESGGLYKACLLEDEGIFYLFYNAKEARSPWRESIGVAWSRDLESWQRFPGNPLLTPGQAPPWCSRFVSDPCVLRLADGRWLMAFYGFDGVRARDGWAVAPHPLGPWHLHPEPWLDVGEPGEIDALYAHKPYLLVRDDCLYHFYCAVGPRRPGQPELGGTFRCVTAAMEPVAECPWMDGACGSTGGASRPYPM